MPDTFSAPRRVQIGSALCDFDQLTVQLGDNTARLEPRLAGVLAVLIERAGETLGRDELLSLAWEADASDEALTQAISRLRKLLGDPSVIETVPRVGYRLAAPVAPGADCTPTPASPPAPPAPPAPPTPAPRARWLSGAALALAAGLCGAALTWLVFGGDRTIEREIEILDTRGEPGRASAPD